MSLAPVTLRRNEIYGSLKVLHKLPSGKYRCLCRCGFNKVNARASALMKGRVTCCKECRGLPACK